MAQLNECFVGGSNLVSLPEWYDDRNESVQRDGTHVTCDSLFWSRATGRDHIDAIFGRKIDSRNKTRTPSDN